MLDRSISCSDLFHNENNRRTDKQICVMRQTKTEKAMLIVSIVIAILLFALAVIEVISLK